MGRFAGFLCFKTLYTVYFKEIVVSIFDDCLKLNRASDLIG